MDKQGRTHLVLTIPIGQQVELSDGSSIYISQIDGRKARVVFLCPPEVRISRTEKYGPYGTTKEQFFRELIERKFGYDVEPTPLAGGQHR